MYFSDYTSAVWATIKSKVSQLAVLDKPQTDLLDSTITEFDMSDKRKLMLQAQDYYFNDNDIKDRKRYYIDRLGNPQEVKNLSNNKLAHAFMSKLTKQKVNYLLAKPLSLQTDNDAFLEALNDYINKAFLKSLKNTGRESVINGIAWMQVYYNLAGRLSFKRIPSEEVIPFWADADHTVLDGIIRYYVIIRYLPNGEKKAIVKVEYYTVNGVWYYEKTDGGLKPDPEKGSGLYGHFMVQAPQTDEEGKAKVDENGTPLYEQVQATWDRVPFIAFKYNSDEVSLLKWIKPLIDDYDINTSDTSNNLQDTPNSIKVVKNYDGTDKGEFVQNLATYRTAFVSGDGDMTSVETKLDITAIDSHLDRLRKDIYEAGSGVDTQTIDLGNASGVALKFRYADLDTDIQDMASEFTDALEQLIWFIKVDLLNNGKGDFTMEDVEIVFNTDFIINEAEVIQDCANSAGIVSDETILSNHPWVKDVGAEMERLKAEKKEKMQEAIDNATAMAGVGVNEGSNFGTNNPDTGNDDKGTKE